VDLAIVLVTHESRAVLAPCLDALGGLVDRVVAVDNASSDGTLELLRSRGVRTLALGENVGFAAAANRGARAASARSLCFLNPDCEADQDLFRAGVAAIAGREDVCAAPRLLERDGVIEGRQPGYGAPKLVFDMVFSNYGDGSICRWLRARASFHDATWCWPHGACFFIPRALFLRLGGFDERFFLYMEDVDLGRRLTAAGARVVPIEREVRHRGASGSRIARRRQLALLNRGRVRYARVHHGPLLALLLAAIALPSEALRAAIRRAA
jgi:GT2 family glycosyltransferase